jgi:hypothetical protein
VRGIMDKKKIHPIWLLSIFINAIAMGIRGIFSFAK